MDLLQQLQEQYIQEFSNNVPLDEFLLNILVTAILVSLLRLFYIHFGQAISNRRRFANNFLPLALGTLLIIMIVKSSIALSLGLVGALSIVRYRAAIKDPEELTFLFIAIGMGLAGGANQPVLAVVALALILGILYISKLIWKQQPERQEGRLFIQLTTDIEDLEKITRLLSSHLPFVSLKRMDTLEQGMELSFIARARDLKSLAALKEEVKALSPSTRLSIVDQPELIV
ncbi:DUF4956 domain-containing protein [Phaeodactylibacter luteus]|uniref:DUF4956 domain-containing protein n=1 Tax=Phaeodactylibacter luteus TaxID=1564516 RepID=A0A5C6RJP3_9BACT|nr:DUF4956 domain-containing protein [Phaeodactylibacter luteus]TXB62373.1 DUF4956 domain-containing protein [Phaeodactylibacter luteus]